MPPVSVNIRNLDTIRNKKTVKPPEIFPDPKEELRGLFSHRKEDKKPALLPPISNKSGSHNDGSFNFYHNI